MGARYNRTSDSSGFLLAIVLFFIVFIIIIFQIKKEEKRRKDIQDYCIRNKIKYSELASDVPTIINFCLLLKEKGENNKWITEMSGVRGDYTFYVFEHFYESGSGKSRTEGTNTICVIKKDGFLMPQFFVRSESLVLDSLGKFLIGGQDINFEEDPDFSRSFILRGKNEKAVRQFFDSKVRGAFVRGAAKACKYEGIENCFVASLPGKLNIENRLKLLANAMNVFREIVPVEPEEDC